MALISARIGVGVRRWRSNIFLGWCVFLSCYYSIIPLIAEGIENIAHKPLSVAIINFP